MHKVAARVLLAVVRGSFVASGQPGTWAESGARAQSGDAAKLPATTAEERAWIVAAAADLEANPMGPKAAGERTHMLFLLMERSDIRVIACTNLVADVPKGDKDNYPVLVQAMYSSASYAVQHNGGNTASVDQMLAGVEGALRVYEKFLKARPADRESALDAVVALRDRGKLREYVAGRPAVCKCCN
jgi:hypothetical protein